MRFDKNNPILPTDAITSKLMTQYALMKSEDLEAGRGLGKIIADAANGSPELAKWMSTIVGYAIKTSTETGRVDTMLPALFLFAMFAGWELAQLHIENQMAATEQSAS